MTYRVTKIINGRAYLYEQTSFRVGKKVKTKSVYLGRVTSFFTPIPVEQQGLRYIERLMEKYPSQTSVGLKVGPNKAVPVEKPPSSIAYATPAVEKAAPAEQSPSQSPDTASAGAPDTASGANDGDAEA